MESTCTIGVNTHHDTKAGMIVFSHEVAVRFVVYAVGVVTDFVAAEADSRADVVLDGVVAEYVAASTGVEACKYEIRFSEGCGEMNYTGDSIRPLCAFVSCHL